MTSASVRRDSRGRKIGYNWWREFICDQLFFASAAWERQAEEAAIGYDTEIEIYARENPRPNLKDLLISNAGMSTR